MCFGAADGGCTDLQQCGAQINFENVLTAPLPTPQGGTIVSGTWVLTRVQIYASGAGWLRQTMRITASGSGGDGGAAEGGGDAAMASDALADGGTEDGSEGGGTLPDATVADAGGGDAGVSFAWETIEVTDTDPKTLATTSGTLTVPASASIDIEYACPASGSFQAGYTATATSLALIVAAVPNQNPGEVLTYTKQ
jgi:hypothetical protein